MQDRDEHKSGDEGSKDENAVNHEIATLLLNLASRTHSSETFKKQSSKPDPDVAMDLSMSQMSGKPACKPGTGPHANIPLLSGQIVAQLNALLFSIHGLTDKNIESKVEVQLAAIYTRLQEIVTLVQITKTKDEKPSLGLTEIKDEPKVSRQDEFPQSSVISVGKTGKISSSISPVENIKSEVGSTPQLRVLPYCKEYEPSSIISRKPGRDGAYTETSPPEKRMKMSPDNCTSSSPPGSTRKTSKGGKGIRNRVFCGDCPGCLKNDDCGQCRYCKDKTKFGGQNRLRQKCLHRRCQMDTHRRSSQQNSAVGGVEPTIYSGVELARLTSHNDDERQAQFSSMLGNIFIKLKPYLTIEGTVTVISSDPPC